MTNYKNNNHVDVKEIAFPKADIEDLEFINKIVLQKPVIWVQTEEDALNSWLGLGEREDSDLLTISSGGCTPLSFLALNARSVISVDINPAETMVTNLKRAAIETLEREDVLALLGINDIAGNIARYQTLRPNLSPGTQSYWDKHLDLLTTKGLLDAGNLQGFGSTLKELAPAKYNLLEKLFASTTVQEQSNLFNSREFESVIEAIIEIRRQKVEKLFNPAVTRILCETFQARLTKAVHTRLLKESAWAAHVLLGHYVDDVLPYYLTPQGFASAKANVYRLYTYTTDLRSFIGVLPTASLDGVDLSNISDLMTEENFQHLYIALKRVLRPGGRIVHRNLIKFSPYPVPTGYIRDEVLSAKLLESERAFLYSSITVDILLDDNN